MVILIIHVTIVQSTEIVIGDAHWPRMPSFVAFSLSVMRPLLQAAPKTGEEN